MTKNSYAVENSTSDLVFIALRLQHITLDSYIPCLTDLCKALWEVMLSYHRTMQWHEEHDKQDASPTGKRLYLCDCMTFSQNLFIFSHDLLFVLTWQMQPNEQFPVRTHYLGAVTERATAHRGSRGCIRSYSHELLVSASNSSTYFYLNCEKSLFVTCCLSQVPHLDLLIKHQICSRYPQMKKWVTYSVSKDFVRAGWLPPLSPGSFISTYRRFISFVAHRKEWLNLRVWKEMRVLNVWRSLKWFWSGKYFFQHLLSPLWLRGHWMSQQKNNYCH